MCFEMLKLEKKLGNYFFLLMASRPYLWNYCYPFSRLADSNFHGLRGRPFMCTVFLQTNNVRLEADPPTHLFKRTLKAPDRCAQLFDRERSLITDKHTEVLDCISYIMVFMLSTQHAEPIYRPLRSMHIV